MVEDANHITPCCYIRHLNGRVTDIEDDLGRRVDFIERQGGTNQFFNSGDVTWRHIIPVLCRRRMVSRLSLVLMSVSDDFLSVLSSLMGDEVYFSGKRRKVVKRLELVLPKQASETDLGRVRDALCGFSDRVTVSLRNIGFECAVYTEQDIDLYPLALIGSQPMEECFCEHSGVLSVSPSVVIPLAEYVHSMARVGMIRNFFKASDDGE